MQKAHGSEKSRGQATSLPLFLKGYLGKGSLGTVEEVIALHECKRRWWQILLPKRLHVTPRAVGLPVGTSDGRVVHVERLAVLGLRLTGEDGGTDVAIAKDRNGLCR